MDLFYTFTDLYEQGHYLEALQTIFKNPDTVFDELRSSNPAFRYLLNYADASVFRGDLDTYFARQTLYECIQANPQQKVLLDQFLEVLAIEQKLRNSFILEGGDCTQVPQFYRPLIKEKKQVLSNLLKYVKLKPGMQEIVAGKKFLYQIPWHVFHYPKQPKINRDNGSLIFLKPCEKSIAHLLGRSGFFVCDTLATFYQLMQFETSVALLGHPESFLYIMELYPQPQFAAQNISLFKGKSFDPMLTDLEGVPVDNANLIGAAIQMCLAQEKEDLTKETPLFNQLYSLSKRLLFNRNAKRYGRDRALAFSIQNSVQEWYDPHKGLPAHTIAIPSAIDLFGEILQKVAVQRKVKKRAKVKKYKVAHVASQLVDGGHAPTRLIQNLLRYCNRTRFTPSLIITEIWSIFKTEYPVCSHYSQSTLERGRESLDFFKTEGIRVEVMKEHESYENLATQLLDLLNSMNLDMVVFHGPDEIHCLAASGVNTPVRVLFEHGTLPKYACFEGAVLSSQEALQIHGNHLKTLGIECYALPFAVDMRKDWLAKPYLRSQLGIPEDAFVMTTISNHLNTRLSDDMCQAIAEILKRSPKAYYMPMGPVDEKKFYDIFNKLGVSHQVRFFGSVDYPSQYARSMDLYLNEFPFGSCLGMLDAMAAGCPVVSMYNEKGPQQGRYGAYFGIERTIRSGNREDYVNLASRLIGDKAFYKEWSQHALKQYEQHVDEKAYVSKFEAFLEKTWKDKAN